MDHFWRLIMRYFDGMGPRQWLIILAAMIIVAVVTMRGFGSRSQY
jgi:hypothetical protein